jgi:hypothetical protein
MASKLKTKLIISMQFLQSCSNGMLASTVNYYHSVPDLKISTLISTTLHISILITKPEYDISLYNFIECTSLILVTSYTSYNSIVL